MLRNLLLALSLIACSFSYGQNLSNQVLQPFSELSSSNQNTISLPDENGVEHEFIIEENHLLSEELKSEFPELNSYNLTSLNNSAVFGKLVQTPNYIMAVIQTEDGLLNIRPANYSNDNNYLIEKGVSEDFNTIEKPSCSADHNHEIKQRPELENYLSNQIKAPDNLNYGSDNSTFDLVIVTTGEFYDENGGTMTDAMAAVTFTVNGWNLIFENELAVSYNLVGTEIYTDETTDPFTPNGSGGDSRTNQATEVIALNFANSLYDIGHVLHGYSGSSAPWSGGGIAGLAVACSNSTFFSTWESSSDGLTGPNKAAGWSGSFSNSNNSWIQLSAHEIGHQMGATHTFNALGQNCNSNSIGSTTAVEIGSGTTIMAYNGICSPQNVPDGGAEDNYFHSVSLDQMRDYMDGISCFTSTSTGNNEPTCNANPTGSTYTIPMGTPFELTGSGSDVDGDNLTYSWEQIDEDGSGNPTQGLIGSAAAANSIAPLFRSYPPSSSPTRIFPELSNIVAGNNTGLDYEALPTVSRTMDFAFVVRDNSPLGGAVCSSPLTVTVDGSTGPFEITSQNSSTTWTADGSANATVTWNVAGTTGGTVNCANVDILLSTDNGTSFSHTLASGVTNDGSHSFLIPNLPTSIGRVKVQCSDNIFFDINDAAIEITSSCLANGASFTPDDDVNANAGDTVLDLDLEPQYGTLISSFAGTLESSDQASSLAANSSGNCVNFNGNVTVADAFSFQVETSGSYTFSTSGGFGTVTHLYEGSFIPSSPCQNWLTGSYTTSNGQIGSSVTETLTAGIEYVLVVASFNGSLPSLPSSYTTTYSGPGDVFEGTPAPAGFDYCYVLVNNVSGNISGFSPDSDLSNSTLYPSGDFQVYGFSYPTGADLSSYVNSPFADFENDLLLLVQCGNLSSNSINVVINGSGCPDADGDGTCDANDGCPNDPNKIAPGICGCGVSDIDTDGDNTADCNDLCPNDPNKIAPGDCGCGVSDVDTDGDNTADCNDLCPNDPNKIAPGDCGCGVSDVDTDGDNTADCNDGCPNDPNKIAPGDCGCGVSDVDTDGDNTADCNDGCPNDPNKIAPGICGCGVSDVDTDGDNIVDCNDLCPNDPNKIAPGDCGCGNADEDLDTDGISDCIDPCPGDPTNTCNDCNDPCFAENGTSSPCSTFLDADSDGTCDANDGCPNDPNKIVPGICGCGVADSDSDGDGTLDCNDGCPNDPNKIAPGDCGCGVSDIDTDGDNTADCNDLCPNDPNKIAPGDCGCGVSDIDTDGDNTADCNDLCPNDPNKIAPGDCGCGVSDIDTDGDNTADCNDLCPNDPNKIAPGDCGCGVSDVDTDGDNTADCNDGCPNDPNKIAPGECGCGVSDVDTDGDNTADCNDLCPNDPNKIAPGDCGCGNADEDLDTDGISDCIDPCPGDPTNACNDCNDPCFAENGTSSPCSTFLDADSDGTCDVNDGCPNDPNKIAPGTCGCGVSDIDTDGDNTADCNDLCPNDPNKIAPGICGCGVSDIDTDGDNTADCNDLCPNDPNKIAPGDCGCGVSDVDTDGDNTADCNDGCPNDPNKIAPGDCGCGVSDVDTDGDNTADCNDLCPNDPNKIAPGDCGCGVSDVDTDGDNTADCNDGCPNDPNKIAPGDCGCGVSDVDTDGDNTADCNDLCPNDPNKIAPGECGCGVSDVDTDGDNTADCNDLCPNDPNKIAPGDCGCGVSDIDTDGDNTADCNDLCPNDPNKSAPGDCGCGTADEDLDTDGISDCIDPCPGDPTNACNDCNDPCFAENGTSSPCSTFLDSDSDGTCDANDGCPNDPNKIAPGDCGCGVNDIDTDGDNTADCNDLCPNDPNKIAPGDCGCGVSDIDTDGDNTADCNDGCPNDPNKIAPGTCGCGVADVDANNDGLIDCLEDPNACEAYNFDTAPTGLFHVQTTGTQLLWDHYSDAAHGCIIKGGTIGTLDENAAYTQAPGQVLIQGSLINGLPNGFDNSANLQPNGTFTLFNGSTFPAGPTGSMVPDAFYKWQVRCGCIIDLSLPLPDRLAFSNVHLSPWSEFDLFTNLSLPQIQPNSETGDTEKSIDLNEVKIYPNPFEDELILDFEDSGEKIVIQILNAMGQLILEREIIAQKGKKSIVFSTHDFERGIYFLNIAKQEEIITHKVVKY